jgi:phosphoenolpyruvate synthase/pyruvate phosphate dikinase
MNQQSIDFCYPCLEYLDSISKVNYANMTDEQLFASYDKFMNVYVPAHASGHPANVLEMKNQRLSRYLKTYLANKLYQLGLKENADEVFSILTEPVANMSSQEEAISFYKLAGEIKKHVELSRLIENEKASDSLLQDLKNNFQAFYEKIYHHYENFCWTPYNWEGPANNLLYYLETLSSFLRQNTDIKEELERLEGRGEKTKENQKNFILKLDIDSKHTDLLQIASDIMFLKSVRKDCMYKAAYITEPMYTEIGKRAGLNAHEARFIFRREMEDFVIKRTIEPELIKRRTKEVVLHQKENCEDVILMGAGAESFIKNLNVRLLNKDIKEIRGQVAFPGKVIGRVKYVNTPQMIEKMENGDILIAYATQPNLLPAMRKASAFVTDFGGITCHAAIVAREWKVPCIIGTKFATKVLKDGDEVEVDADRGIVRILEKNNK